jgi:hypothetical protein
MSDQGYVSLTLTRLRQDRAHSPSAEPKDANFLKTAPLPAGRASARGVACPDMTSDFRTRSCLSDGLL